MNIYIMKFTFYVFLLLSVFIASTQNKALVNPRKAVEHHLIHLQDNKFHPEVSLQALDTSGLGMSADDAARSAIKLKQIFDGVGHKVQTEGISEDENYADSLRENVHGYVVFIDFEDLYVEKTRNGEWKYSSYSVSQIERIHKEVYPFGTYLLLELFSKNGSDKTFGLYTYQYVGVLLIVILCFIIHKTFTFFFDKILLRFLKQKGLRSQGEKYVLPTVKAFSLFLAFLMALILVPVLQLPLKMNNFLIISLKATLPIFWTIIFYRVVDVVASYFEKVAEKTESTLDDQLVPLLRKALKVFVVIIGALVVLQNLSINVTALLAGLSIGGLAFALAAQDMLKNFFGSLMIFIDKPFGIGDWVSGKGVDGDIEEIGFRSTRIRTFHNSVVSVPNGVIADMTIDNLGMRQYRRYKTYLAVTYDTSSVVLDLFTEGIRQLVINHPETPDATDRPFHVYVNAFGESSIDILVYIFFEVPTWGDELRVRHEINLQIMELAETMGVRFAFRTQTLHIEEFPEKKPNTPLKDDLSDVKSRMSAYLNKNK